MAVGDHVDDEPLGRLGREDVRAPREVLLHDVVLRRALQTVEVDALFLGQREVEPQSHAAVALMVIDVFISVEGEPVEELAHVAEVRDRHADLADLAARRAGRRGRSRVWVGRSKAIESPVWPLARFER